MTSALQYKESYDTGAEWSYSYCCALTLLVDGFDKTKLAFFRSLNSGPKRGDRVRGSLGVVQQTANLKVLKKRNNPCLPIILLIGNTLHITAIPHAGSSWPALPSPDPHLDDVVKGVEVIRPQPKPCSTYIRMVSGGGGGNSVYLTVPWTALDATLLVVADFRHADGTTSVGGDVSRTNTRHRTFNLPPSSTPGGGILPCVR